MAVSANTLFHFTKFATLQKIISSKGFWPQYSKEHFHKALPKSSTYLVAYIPMICFCDLKLTQLSDNNISLHTKYFGNYGIGFQKKWGIANKVSPVSYVHEKSVASNTIVKIISKINNSHLQNKKSFASKLGQIVKFLKPYRGYYQKGRKRNQLINYYDEREWRYIPNDDKYEAFPYNKKIKKTIDKYNIELQKSPLTFTNEDIKYIVVEKDKDKLTLSNRIISLGLSKNVTSDLISKIISFAEIKDDF